MQETSITLNNTTERDKGIIQNIINKPNQFPLLSKIKKEALFKRIEQMVLNIKKGGKRIQSIKVSIDEEPKLNMEILLSYKNIFLSPFDYCYLKKQNVINTQLNYSFINNHLTPSPNAIIKENQLSIGLGVYQNIDKYNYYIKNQALTHTPFEFEVKMQKTKQNNHTYYSHKSSTKLNVFYNLIKRPFAFRDYLPYDNINWFKLQLSNKSIENKHNDTIKDSELNNSNSRRIKYLPEDKQLKAKASYEYNKQNEINFNWFNIKVSNSIVKGLQSLYSKTSLFIRKTINMKDIFLQLNCEGSKIFPSRNDNELQLHDELQVNKYRGLYNKSVIQGLTHYLLLSSKLYLHSFLNIPKFNLEDDGFMVAPFTHLNLFITNNNPMLISAGIGASMITKLFSFEMLYTPYIKKASSDVHSLFQIKLGID